MGYMFGTDEKLTCIVDVSVKGGNDEALCLAYKARTFSILAPLYLKDDGYVLAVKSGTKSYYPMPGGAELEAMQATGALPKPLPPYTIPTHQYVFGYLFWIVVALVVLFGFVKKAVKDRRKSSLASGFSEGPTSLVVRTKTDRWLADEAAKLLGNGETVEQQAYGIDTPDPGIGSGGLYVVLTNRRLIVIKARVGGFGPLRENRGVTVHERNAIARAEGDERHVRFVMKDGAAFDFFAEWSERHLSNQRRFLRDIPTLFAAPMALMPSLEPG